MHDYNTVHNNEESRRGGPDKAFGMFLSTHDSEKPTLSSYQPPNNVLVQI